MGRQKDQVADQAKEKPKSDHTKPNSSNEKEENVQPETTLSENESVKSSQSSQSEVKNTFWNRLKTYAFEEDDISYLVAFRILWGSIMFYEIMLFIVNDYTKITHRLHLNPYGFNFKYFAFHWVKLLPFEWTVIFMWSMLAAAAFIVLGLQYRLATTYFFFGITYIFFVESTNYLNHIYLVCVISFLMIFIPCNATLSGDVLKNPNLKRDTVPK
jgi:hypothetical protein